MKLTLERRKYGEFVFYDTTIFNTKVGLSKNMVTVLQKRDLLHSDCEIPVDIAPHVRLTAQQVSKNGKTYTNLYLRVTSDCPGLDEKEPAKQAAQGSEEDLPF